MSQAQISLRISAELKEQADEVLRELDSSPTQAITMLYQYIATNKKLPFANVPQVKTPDEIRNYVVSRFCTALDTLRSIATDLLENNGLDGRTLMIKTTQVRDIQGDVLNHILAIDESERDAVYQVLNAMNEATSACTGVLNFGFGMVTVKVSEEEKRRIAAGVEAFEARFAELDADLPF